MLSRAQGCFLGLLIGDAFACQVLGQSVDSLLRDYPNGVRDLLGGGPYDLLPGQPGGASEVALMLAHCLIVGKSYSAALAKRNYAFWLESKPFTKELSTVQALNGIKDYGFLTQGCLMRMIPISIWGAYGPPENLAQCARLDSNITHPNLLCQYVCSLYAMALGYAISHTVTPVDLYLQILDWITEFEEALIADSPTKLQIEVEQDLLQEPYINRSFLESFRKIKEVTLKATNWPVTDGEYVSNTVLVAWQNAMWHLLHSDSVEYSIVETVRRGSCEQPNAAVCGALLGAVLGKEAFPQRWIDTILNCYPDVTEPAVHTPRPDYFWPSDILDLSATLLEIGRSVFQKDRLTD